MIGAGSTPFDQLLPADQRMLFVVGAYGSGKTEVSVNLAIAAAAAGRQVRIADLDIVNPYFRSREARLVMEQYGIDVVAPPGAQAFADLPILLPEIWGMMHPRGDQLSLFDVGGDDVGATVLSSFHPTLEEGAYQLFQVINARRPFSRTVEECLAAKAAIEGASRLRITGWLVNSHLMEETTPDVLREGWELGRAVAAASGVPVRCVSAMRDLLELDPLAEVDVPILPLDRHMLPPWKVVSAPPEERRLPAVRPTPIGVATRIATQAFPPGDRHAED